jgi:hypothetical protein
VALNEADTRAKLIDPKVKLAGWGESQIEREHYFVKGRKVTDGRIYLVGEESRRREPRRVDFLLRYNGQMIAVLEAKDERHSPDGGLEQAKSYARLLDVPFAYSAIGHALVEFDFSENRSRELTGFPAPDELWNRWQTAPPERLKPAELAAEARRSGRGTGRTRWCTRSVRPRARARSSGTSRRSRCGALSSAPSGGWSGPPRRGVPEGTLGRPEGREICQELFVALAAHEQLG